MASARKDQHAMGCWAHAECIEEPSQESAKLQGPVRAPSREEGRDEADVDSSDSPV